MKEYTRKQIVEAIAHWKQILEEQRDLYYVEVIDRQTREWLSYLTAEGKPSSTLVKFNSGSDARNAIHEFYQLKLKKLDNRVVRIWTEGRPVIRKVDSADELADLRMKRQDRLAAKTKYDRRAVLSGRRSTPGASGIRSSDAQLAYDVDDMLTAIDNYTTWNSKITQGDLLSIEDVQTALETYEDLPDFEKQHDDSDIDAMQTNAADQVKNLREQWLVTVTSQEGKVKIEQYETQENAESAAQEIAKLGQGVKVGITEWHADDSGNLVCDALPEEAFPLKRIMYKRLSTDPKAVRNRMRWLLRTPEQRKRDSIKQSEYDKARVEKYGKDVLNLRSKIYRLSLIMTDRRYADLQLTLGEIDKAKQQAMKKHDTEQLELLQRQRNKAIAKAHAELNSTGDIDDTLLDTPEQTVAQLKDLVIQLKNKGGTEAFTPGIISRLNAIATKSNNSDLADAIKSISGTLNESKPRYSRAEIDETLQFWNNRLNNI